MKTYLAVCTLLFALVAVAHGTELAQSGSWRLREPDFVGTSLITLGMVVWSALLLWREWRRH